MFALTPMAPKAKILAIVVTVSEEKVQSKDLYQTTRRKSPRHIVLFIVTATYTCV